MIVETGLLEKPGTIFVQMQLTFSSPPNSSPSPTYITGIGKMIWACLVYETVEIQITSLYMITQVSAKVTRTLGWHGSKGNHDFFLVLFCKENGVQEDGCVLGLS